jgi:hypothetical protein
VVTRTWYTSEEWEHPRSASTRYALGPDSPAPMAPRSAPSHRDDNATRNISERWVANCRQLTGLSQSEGQTVVALAACQRQIHRIRLIHDGPQFSAMHAVVGAEEQHAAQRGQIEGLGRASVFDHECAARGAV